MSNSMIGQESMFGPDLWSGKMSPELSVPEPPKAQTSKRSCRKSSASSAKKPPLFLYLQRDGLLPGACPEWATTVPPHFPYAGAYTTRSTGDSPRDAVESRLSQILEDSPHPKYSLSKYALSAKACQGILNRAARRGKELPPELKAALEAQASAKPELDTGSEESRLSAPKERTDQADQATSCCQTNTVWSPQGGGATSQNSQGSTIGEDVSFTLNATDRHGIAYETPKAEEDYDWL